MMVICYNMYRTSELLMFICIKRCMIYYLILYLLSLFGSLKDEVGSQADALTKSIV